jgi:hypothetical protein
MNDMWIKKNLGNVWNFDLVRKGGIQEIEHWTKYVLEKLKVEKDDE